MIKMNDEKDDRFVYVYPAQKKKRKQATFDQIREIKRIREKYTVKEVSFEEKTSQIKNVQKVSMISIVLRGLFGALLLICGIFLVLAMKMFALGFVQILVGWHVITYIYVVYKKIQAKLMGKFQEK